MKFLKLTSIALPCLILLPVAICSAATVTYLDIYNQNMTTSGFIYSSNVQSSILTGTNFDPAHGSLTGVDITFSGNINFNINTGQNFTVGAHGTIIYLPYNITPTMLIDITGINSLYSFTTPLELSITLPVSGVGNNYSINHSYSFSFSYNSLINKQFFGPNDVSSGSLLTTPEGLVGSLSDFIDTDTAPNLLFINELRFMETGGRVNTSQSLVNVNNSLIVSTTYTYTPSAVPVPAAIWLFGSGLIGLIGLARRKA